MIRRALHSDIPRIREIRERVRENRLLNPGRVTASDVAWFVDGPGIWVWDENGCVLGFSAGDTRDGSVWALFVDPSFEGRGIGRALLGRACDVLKDHGHTVLTVATLPGTRAEKFYEAAGWTASCRNAFGETVLRKRLLS